MDRMIVCSFSGALANLPKANRTPLDALQVLEKHPRVSTFDRCEKPWLNRLLNDLLHRGLIMEINDPYPWHRYELMTTGRQMLVGHETPNVKLTGTLRRAGFGLGFWSPNLDRRKVSG